MAAKLPNYSVTESQLGGIVLLVDEAGNPLIVTGRTLTNARPVDVSIVDANGNQITSFGGGTGGGAGTEYADGAVRGTATGTLAMGDDGTNIQSVKVDASGVLAIQDNGGSLTVDGTFFQATQPISAAALPLPAGAATSALQTQPGVDIGDVTVNNAAGAAAVNVQDGGNSITVDGTFFQATQPVSAASLPLPTGAATSALQTQPGVDIGDVTINNAAGAAAVNVQDGGNSLTVDGAISFTAPQHVIVDSGGGGGIQFADGAARGTATGTIAMGDDGTNIQSVKVDTSGVLAIQDNGGSITVDGTVTTSPPANASTNVAQLAGTATSVNSGVKDAGTLRVVLATDQPQLTNKLLVTPDSVALPANQSVNVNQFAGVAVATGTGAGGAGIPRVTVSNDSSIATITTSVTPGTAAANLGKAEDAAHASTDTGVFVLGVRQDTPNGPVTAALTNADSDYSAIVTDDHGVVWTRKRQLVSFAASYRLADATAGQLPLTFTFAANTNKQLATIYHSAAAVRTIKIRKISIVVSTGAAGVFDFEIRTLTATTAPATGNPAINPAGLNPVDTGSQATCLALPTTAGSILGADVSTVSPTFSWNSAAAAAGGNPSGLAGQEIVLYEYKDGMELKPLTIRGSTAEGFAVYGRCTAAVALRFTIFMLWTEE